MVPRELLDLDLEPSIGAKIKKIRTARGMTIRTLASDSGFSPSFISQLENGHTNASIGTLRILSTALGLSFLDLFEPDVPTGRVLRKADRPMLPTASGSRKYAITLPPLQSLEIYISELVPGQSTGHDQYTHGDSQEVVYILSGHVEFYLSGIPYQLSKGDSMEFRSSEPHKLHNASDDDAEVMWINAPPTPRNPPPREA